MLQPLRLVEDGVEDVCMLAELEERLPTGKARAAAMQQRMPIHSFLFDQQGLLLHANHAATRRWTEKGKLRLHHQVTKEQAVMRKQVPMLLRGRNPSLYVPNDGEEGDGVWTRYTRAVLSGPPSAAPMNLLAPAGMH